MTLENQTNTDRTEISKVQTSLRIKESVKIQLDNILRKINDKPYGRKVFPSTLLESLFKFVDDSLVRDLQTKSLKHAERWNQLYQQYVQKFGPTSKEEFEKKSRELMSQWAKENPAEFTGNLSY
jgi:hypothetical protein